VFDGYNYRFYNKIVVLESTVIMLIIYQLQRAVTHFKKVQSRSCRREPAVSDTKALNSVPACPLLRLHYIRTDCRRRMNKIICLKSLKTSRKCRNVWFSESHQAAERWAIALHN